MSSLDIPANVPYLMSSLLKVLSNPRIILSLSLSLSLVQLTEYSLRLLVPLFPFRFPCAVPRRLLALLVSLERYLE